MTSATARAKAVNRAPMDPKETSAFYAKSKPSDLAEHCVQLTQAVLMASGGDYRDLTKMERGLIEEAADLRLVPSATIVLANVLCARSGKGARETLSELIQAQVEGSIAEAESKGKASGGSVEDAAFASLIALMTDVQKKHGLVEAFQVAMTAFKFVDEVSLDLEKEGEKDMAIHRSAASAGLIPLLEDMRREIAKVK